MPWPLPAPDWTTVATAPVVRIDANDAVADDRVGDVVRAQRPRR